MQFKEKQETIEIILFFLLSNPANFHSIFALNL